MTDTFTPEAPVVPEVPVVPATPEGDEGADASKQGLVCPPLPRERGAEESV